MTNNDPCHGCVHYVPISLNYGENEQKNTRYCNYIGHSGGHRRPCPFGEGCTVKETGKRKRIPMHKFDIGA